MTISRTQARKRMLRWQRYISRYPNASQVGWVGWGRAADALGAATTYAYERSIRASINAE